MPTNIEIKATVEDLAALRERVRPLATGGPEVLHQEDVFFRASRGRLKLRIFDPHHAELIAYERADGLEPTASHYQISQTSEPAALRSLLRSALGEIATVIKRRELFHIGQTRVHLDEVEGLGSFMELEVVLADGDSESTGTSIARELMARLAIAPTSLLTCAYVDLLAARS